MRSKPSSLPEGTGRRQARPGNPHGRLDGV